MRAHVVVPVLLLALAATAGEAREARAEEGTPGTFVSGTIDRGRRAVSFGPFVGVGVGGFTGDGGELDVPLRFGIGLVLFKIPVAPSPKEVQAMVEERVKARLKERVKQMVTAGAPAPDEQELARMAAEILSEVKAEVLNREAYRGKKWEKPKLSLAVEGAYGLAADGQQLGLTAGIGISRFTIGPTIAASFTDGFGDALAMVMGGELAMHLTPRPRARSHVLTLFLRADTAVAGDGATRIEGGVRMLLDLI